MFLSSNARVYAADAFGSLVYYSCFSRFVLNLMMTLSRKTFGAPNSLSFSSKSKRVLLVPLSVCDSRARLLAI